MEDVHKVGGHKHFISFDLIDPLDRIIKPHQAPSGIISMPAPRGLVWRGVSSHAPAVCPRALSSHPHPHPPETLHQVGGTPAVLKYLHAKGLIDGTTMTCTGELS
jgi:hypothetical protein